MISGMNGVHCDRHYGCNGQLQGASLVRETVSDTIILPWFNRNLFVLVCLPLAT